MNEQERAALIEDLNRAFGSRSGDTPRFTAEAEGDDYLFGRPATLGENREERDR